MKNNNIWNICANTKSTGLKFCRVDELQQLHKTLIFPFEWRGPGAHCVAMEMSQWTYQGTLNECNNCTEFQFYTEKVVRDIQVTSHLICINQSLE